MIRLARKCYHQPASFQHLGPTYTHRAAVKRPSARQFWNIRETVDSRNEEPKRLTPTEASHKLRDLLRSVPHALTVITSVANEDNKPTGLLASSFNSVTLYPIPYVSFNIKVPSTTLKAIKSSGHFTASTIDSPQTADVFAQQVPGSDKMKEGILRPNGKLEDGCGGVLWMKCKWLRNNVTKVGDHAIMVGEVLDFGSYEGKDLAGDAMVYWQGHYTLVGLHNHQAKLGLSSLSAGTRHKSGGRFRKVPWPPPKPTRGPADTHGEYDDSQTPSEPNRSNQDDV